MTYVLHFFILRLRLRPTAKGRSLSGPNIRLRPKVKIVPTVQHCNLLSLYHITEIKWRPDKRCGKKYLLPDGKPAQCNPAEPLGAFCCSHYGYCGGNSAHCECTNCIDYRIGKTFQNVIKTGLLKVRKFLFSFLLVKSSKIISFFYVHFT